VFRDLPCADLPQEVVEFFGTEPMGLSVEPADEEV
jgi:hypothetical protein